MRQWLVDPGIMCRKHLLGEHFEHHMFLSHILKGRKVEGYINHNLLEPMSLFARHEHLVQEMGKRGYHHKSPIKPIEFLEALSKLPDEICKCYINIEESLSELLNRCDECRKRYEKQNT